MGYIGKWYLDVFYKFYVDIYNNCGKVVWNEWCLFECCYGFDYWIVYGIYDYYLKLMYWNIIVLWDSFYYVN